MIELLVVALVAGVALEQVLAERRRAGGGLTVAAAATAVVASALLGVWTMHEPEWLPEADLPPPREDAGYTTSRTCRSCHPSQYASWHRTFHRTMTQPASPATVVAPFDGVELSHGDDTARLERVGNEFWVETVDPDWKRDVFIGLRPDGDPPRLRRRVVMTTGSHHFQVYWIRGGHGRELRQFPWRYHIASGRWIHRSAVFVQDPDLPESEQDRIWNGHCFPCHQVAMLPGLDPSLGEYSETEVVELGIACEACHGPGGEHIRANRDPSRRYPNYWSDDDDPTIVNPAKLPARESSELCGQCHSYVKVTRQHLIEGYPYQPGDALHDAVDLFEPKLTSRARRRTGGSSEGGRIHRFWADGNSRSGGREYSAMSTSGCYLGGTLSCLSCHSMHQSDPVDQISGGMAGDEACLQCHEGFREDVSAHTHHDPESSGSRCYNCHMPHTSYALYKAIRSHQIDSPRVEGVIANGRPNACNLCHLDRTLEWTALALSDWYGVDATVLSEEERNVAASLLWLLRGDAGQRVVLAWHMGWEPTRVASGRDWMAPFLAQLLDDPYPAVRFVAERSLRSLPGHSEIDYAFDDPPERRAEAVERVTEAWLRTPQPSDRVGPTLLLDPPRTLRRAAVKDLVGRRDDRPITIIE